MLRRTHEPRSRIVGNSRLGPAFKRGEQRILGKILGDSNVADNSGKRRDEFR
jgi:hypothetical protein